MKSSVQITRGIESLFGTRDENIKLIENGLNVTTRLAEGDKLEVEGDESQVRRAERILSDYVDMVQSGHEFSNGDLNSYLRVAVNDPTVSLSASSRVGSHAPMARRFWRRRPSISADTWMP